MKDSIFDLVDADLPVGKEGYLELASRAPQPKEKSFLNDVADYAKTFIKGGVEGISRLGRIMGPIKGEKTTSQQLEEQTETLNQLLPTDEGYIQSSIRRGLKEAPTMLASPGSTLATLPRSLLAGFMGEGAKELGAPEWAQTAAEITAYIGPDVTKKLIEKGSNKELIEAGRKLGLSDEALTPLLQSDFKQKWLSKLAPKRGATADALEKSKSGLSNVYTNIQQSPEALIAIPEEAKKRFMESMGKRLFTMPAEVRNRVKEDFRDLLASPITGETLMNFYSDVNHYLGDNTKQLSLLKEPIKDALSAISPQMGKDFDIVNNLYSKYHKISSKLQPSLASDIVNWVENLGLFGSVFNGNYHTMVGILGEKAARKLAQQMLINPRFQKLSQKMVVAFNQNKFGLAQKVTNDFKKEIAKFDPESAEKIEPLSEKEFEDLLSHQKKAKT